MILGEIIVSVLGVLLLDLGSWTSWFSLAIVIAGVVLIYLVLTSFTIPGTTRSPKWAAQHKVLNWVRNGLRQFRAGTAVLAQPRVVGITILLSALYVLMAGVALYVVILGLDIAHVTFQQAVAVSCFGLAFYVVLGSLEAAEVGAFISIGVGKSEAVSAILVNRALTILATVVLAGITMALLRDEWSGLRRGPPGMRQRSSDSPAQPATTQPEPNEVEYRTL
jgi:uncharacterized membrane protein YbhN (UPF0104 family)